MIKIDKIKLGIMGEDIAANHLRQKGFEIVTRNYRCNIGEIDIVCLDEDFVVFVEVRTKTSERYGSPEESLTARKISKIRRVAQYFLLETSELKNMKIRFDFVGVNLEKPHTPGDIDQMKVDHHIGVF